MKITFAILCIAAAALNALYVCRADADTAAAQAVRRAGEVGLPEVRRARIVFGGDVMVHTPQLTAAAVAGGGYDFSRSFGPVAELFREADLAVVNLETTLSHRPPYTGYPMFRSPAAVAEALRDAGVDAAGLANNHICDRGASGIASTVGVLDSIGIAYTGAYADSSAIEAHRPLYLEAGELTVAMLNYTYGTNGLPVPHGMAVDMIDTTAMLRDMSRVDRRRADCVCIFIHWGEEYQRRPNTSQRRIADFCRRHGAELVVGSHPHVVQAVERDTLGRWIVAYSLGNMVSNQQWRYSDGGFLLDVRLSRVGDAPVSMEVDVVPVWVSCPGYLIVTPEAAGHIEMTDAARLRYERFIADCNEILEEKAI